MRMTTNDLLHDADKFAELWQQNKLGDAFALLNGYDQYQTLYFFSLLGNYHCYITKDTRFSELVRQHID